MPFSDYIILGPRFLFGEYQSVRRPSIWPTMTDWERVFFCLNIARTYSRGKEKPNLAWVTTAAFYEVGINLFRNEMSRLERGGYIVEKEPVEGIRDIDGKPRKWYRYRLIETPEERARRHTAGGGIQREMFGG